MARLPKNFEGSPPSLSQPAIIWYEGESCIGLPPMVVPPCPNMRFVVVWLEGPGGEFDKPAHIRCRDRRAICMYECG